MSDLKTFLEKNSFQRYTIDGVETYKEINSYYLGMFFWEELIEVPVIKSSSKIHKEYPEENNNLFLVMKYYEPRLTNYCVACLGEEKIKKLILSLERTSSNDSVGEIK